MALNGKCLLLLQLLLFLFYFICFLNKKNISLNVYSTVECLTVVIMLACNNIVRVNDRNQLDLCIVFARLFCSALKSSPPQNIICHPHSATHVDLSFRITRY